MSMKIYDVGKVLKDFGIIRTDAGSTPITDRARSPDALRAESESVVSSGEPYQIQGQFSADAANVLMYLRVLDDLKPDTGFARSGAGVKDSVGPKGGANAVLSIMNGLVASGYVLRDKKGHGISTYRLTQRGRDTADFFFDLKNRVRMLFDKDALRLSASLQASVNAEQAAIKDAAQE
jgi:hypothetical protein